VPLKPQKMKGMTGELLHDSDHRVPCRLVAPGDARIGCERLAGPPWPAASGATLWSSPADLQSAGHVLRLLRIFLGRAPEDDAAGHAPDRDGDVQVVGHAKDVVFHALWGNLRTQADTGGLARERLNLVAQRIIEHRLHAGPASHTAGFVERHVIELKIRGLLGHRKAPLGCILGLINFKLRVSIVAEDLFEFEHVTRPVIFEQDDLDVAVCLHTG
jgi:hypothetical protein